jgi:hypothetical protein
MDGSLLSDAMLFPRNSVECRKGWSDLLKVESCDDEILKYVFGRLAGKDMIEDLQKSGLVRRLYMEASGILPIRLPVCDIQTILKKRYSEGVFYDFTPSDLSVVSRIFPNAYDIGGDRTSNKIGMLGCVAGVIRPVVDKLGLKVTHEEVESFCAKMQVSSIALMLNDRIIYRPLKVDTVDCLKVIRQLFPEGMFHEFNKIETLFMAHLFPKNGEIDEEGLNFFTECLIGVMRTLILKEFRSSPEGEALLRRYFSLEPFTVSSFCPFGTVDEVTYRTVRSMCACEKLVPIYSAKEISAEDRKVIQGEFEKVSYSDCISIDADCTSRVWNSLAPSRVFHVFSQEEAILLNFMQPVGLSAEGRLIWMELLAGSYKSMFFNKNVAQPLSNELIKDLAAMEAKNRQRNNDGFRPTPVETDSGVVHRVNRKKGATI